MMVLHVSWDADRPVAVVQASRRRGAVLPAVTWLSPMDD